MDSLVLIKLFLQQYVKPFLLETLLEFAKTQNTELQANGIKKSDEISLLTTKEISQAIKFNRHKIYQFISTGELKAVEIGGEYRFRQEDLQEFINKRITGQK